MLKRLTITVLGIVLLLVAVVLLNTYRKGSRQIEAPSAESVAVDAHAAAQRLAGAVRIRTVSYDDRPAAAAEELRKLHAYIEQQYPKAHAVLKREVVADLSLLYTWEGTDAAAKPIVLMAHQDVVPIAPGTEKDWKFDPFSGAIQEGFIWGRGTWDDKGNLFAIMEAVELLTGQGFKPRQRIHLAFGHDEEVGGEKGAKQIAALLKSRGVKADFVLDEGLIITSGVLKGLDSPVALIGIAEKGFLTLALSTATTGGHSSMSPPNTAIGTMSAALARLERDPMPASLGGVTALTFDAVAPEMNFLNRVVLSNLWLFGPVVRSQLEKSASTNALVRTTTAFTVFQAGNKENVLPDRAEARVNFRLAPGDTREAVIAHAVRAIDNPAVSVEPVNGANAEASAVSPIDSRPYRLIARTVRELFPGTVVAPGLMIGATDSRHMREIADHIFRFSPVRATAEDLPRFHGTNERMSVKNHTELIAFYHRLLTNAAKAAE
jgi:carboxypeptidase PM20D1